MTVRPYIETNGESRVLGGRAPRYDPKKRKISGQFLTTYDEFHEIAHQVQHRIGCRAYRFWARFNGIRVMQYFATIFVEYDALRRARHAMQWESKWSGASEKEAFMKLGTYIRRREN